MLYTFQGLRNIPRYNDTFGSDERHPLVRTLSIPSPLLQSHRIEILVHTVGSTFDPTNGGAASFLVPGLEIANSASGRSSMVTYPVHKALIYGEGLTSLGQFSMIEAQGIQRQQGSMMKGAIDWSWSTAQQQNTDGQPLVPINLSLAETAIEAFRSSLNRSLDYEHLWFDAGIPALSTWLIDGTGSQSGSMKLATRRLIETLSENTSQGIQHEASVKLQQEEDATVPVKSRVVIGQGISIWAENAHTELRDRLNSAFGSKSWGKTKWWKLFWRADDVGYIASDILRQAWLTEGEKEMIWVCGRIHQSGLLGPPKLRPEPVVDPEDEEQKLGGMPPAPSAEDLAPKTTDFNEPPPARHPWPQAIARARSTLSSMTVPPLQALSQALLLQTVSTNVLASSLSALLYVSISSTSPYESGAIAATGLAYSLRRLQRRWVTARGEWEVAVREEGRRVLRSMESVLREPVDEYKPGVDKDGIKDRATATQAIGKVKKELEAIKV